MAISFGTCRHPSKSPVPSGLVKERPCLQEDKVALVLGASRSCQEKDTQALINCFVQFITSPYRKGYLVMHEADDAYSIWSTWSCYWLDQFLTLALDAWILSKVSTLYWICLLLVFLILVGVELPLCLS